MQLVHVIQDIYRLQNYLFYSVEKIAISRLEHVEGLAASGNDNFLVELATVRASRKV